MEKNKEEFNEIVNQLKLELGKIVMANPSLLRLLGHEKIKISFEENNKHVEYEYDSETIKKFRVLEKYRSLIFFIIGFAFCSLIMVLCYVLFKNNIFLINNKIDNNLPNPNENSQKVLSFLFSAMPIVLFVFSLIIAFWTYFLRAVDTKDLLDRRIFSGILLTVVSGITTYIAARLKHELLLFMCPLLGYIIVLLSLRIIYEPLCSRTLNKTIITNAERIRKKLDSLNKSIVHESHSEVIERIEHVENMLHENNMDALSKIHSLTVLDSLRLELIQSSRNGINLVEDWKYLDLSQKMIEEIMTCENKKITILGDLSFLSKESGLEKLVTAIKDKDKEFLIYFTGEKIDGTNTIKSNHCQELVNNIRNIYDEKDQEVIKKKIYLRPISSESFTGIGFIGLRDNNNDNKVYKKVYAYISSMLIPEKNIDITRANPFVFCWDSHLEYFSAFLKSKMVFDDNLRVEIDGNSIKADDILNFKKRSKKRKKQQTLSVKSAPL